jgi:tetratricopeptide (TPR) repeat protein
VYVELGDLWGQASVNLNLGTSYAALAMLDRALEHFETALDISTRIGNVKEAGLAHVNIAEAHVMRGDYDLAIEHLTTALDACGRSGRALWLEGYACLNLARAYQGKGMLSEAMASVQQSIAWLTKAQTPGMLAESLVQRAELELVGGSLKVAARTCDSALDLLSTLGMTRIESNALRVRGLILRARGDDQAAEESLVGAVESATRAAAPFERGIALLALADLYSRPGDTTRRARPYRRLLREATRTFTRVGARVWIQRAEEFSAART